MNRNEKVSLVVHGPLDKYCLFTLNKYKSVYDVIIVSPKPSNKEQQIVLEEILATVQDNKNNISMMLYNDVIPDTADNIQNRYLHFLSVSIGLLACKTEYVIKLRSDEFYSDITPFVEMMYEHKNKLVTTEVFFRNSSMLFHPSDHLVGGKTTLMRDTFQLAKYLTEKAERKLGNVFLSFISQSTKNQNYTAEQILGCSLLTIKYPKIEIEEIDCIQMMKDSFHIITTNNLGNFRVRASSQKPDEYFDTSFFIETSDINNIEKYK